MVRNPVLGYVKPDYPTQLFDFEGAILNSVLPYKYFSKFIDLEHKEYRPFLQTVTTYQRWATCDRLLSNKRSQLDSVEKEELLNEKGDVEAQLLSIYQMHKKLFDPVIDQDIQRREGDSHKSSINSELQNIPDMDSLNVYCMMKLKQLYIEKFIGSQLSRILIEELSNSVIEFRFLQTAGLVI